MHGARLRKVLIIGAGIGGLSAAHALRRADIEARVFERADDLRRLQAGNGFFLWNNGVRASQHLGILDRLQTIASPPLERFEIQTPSGRLLVELSLSELERQAGVPSLGVPRGELHRVLADAVGPAVVQTGAECTGFTQDERSVTAHFTDGRDEQGDLLIGADGLNSKIRPFILGGDEPNYAGYSLWFSIVESDFASLRVFRTFLDHGIRFTFLPVGPKRVTWVSIANARPGGSDDRSGLKGTLLARHHGWMEPVEQVIADTEESKIHRLDSYSRTPVDHWSKGRVTLFG